MKSLTTKNGQTIPMVGLGTYPLQGEDMAKMAIEAFKCGFRLIDTADDYRGETGLGLALSRLKSETGLKREDVFIQTKISQDNAHGDEPLEGVWFNKLSKYQNRHTVEEVVMDKMQISLRELKTDYIDSLLIHYPFPGYYEEIWKVMMKLKKEGIVRYIGVSNFHTKHIDILKALGECPSINQIYISPIGTKQEDVEYAEQNNIQLMTYSPLIDVVKGHLDDSILSPIAEKYGKTEPQIILRWNVDRGSMPLPRTKNQKRLKENFDIFDFKLTVDEINKISSMNKNHQYLIESKQCPGI
jgi:diketogulonate reductase-like aldo/keto reductase